MPTVKTPFDDMYLLEGSIRMENKLEEAKEFLKEIGEDPTEYTNKQLLHMLENGF